MLKGGNESNRKWGPTKWGIVLKSTWEQAGKGEMRELLIKGVGGRKFLVKMGEALNILNNQDTQQDFIGVNKSRYWEWYKTYKGNCNRAILGRKKYKREMERTVG